MWYKNIAGRFFGLVTKHTCDRWTDGQNYNSQDHASIAASGGKKDSDMDNFICHRYGERLAILNTENIKICGYITKLDTIKNAICLHFLTHLQQI